MTALVISVHFLDRRFHGVRPGRSPEWPPSPSRLYQALVAAAFTGARRTTWNGVKQAAFQWLERQHAPDIHAPDTRRETSYRLYAPTNDMDSVAAAWARWTEPHATPAQMTKAVDYAPQAINGDATVRYVWPLQSDDIHHAEVIADAARYLLAVGHGEDFVAGRGVLMDAPAGLPGTRYTADADGFGSTAPAPGFLNEIMAREEARKGRPTVLPPLRCIRLLRYIPAGSTLTWYYHFTEAGTPVCFAAGQRSAVQRAVAAVVQAITREIGEDAAVGPEAIGVPDAPSFCDLTVTLPQRLRAMFLRLHGASIAVGDRRVILASDQPS